MKTRAPLNTAALEALRALQSKKPIYLLARDLGLSVDATARALAGGELQIATRSFIENRLKDLTSGNSAQVGTGAAA